MLLSMTAKNKYFGTDGIRGIPNKDLDVSLLENLGKSLRILHNNTVVIATDTRYSKDLLAFSIISGCLSSGLKVIYAGVLSTPALIYYSYIHKVVGVMITASHNPYYYNGVKIINNGYKLNNKEEEQLEQELTENHDKAKETGTFLYQPEILQEYILFLSPYLQPCNLKVCIDCANGSDYKIAPFLFSKICHDLVLINHQPNGYNINESCGATHIENLQSSVLAYHCDIGFAYDGDGDRVICVDHNGNIIDGDLLIYILAVILKEQDCLKQNKVVMTVMSNLGIIHALKKQGIEVIEVPVGDKNVAAALKENQLSLGGEASGHIIVPKLFHSGDGLLMSLYLLRILKEQNKTIADYTKDIQLYTNRMINIKVSDKNSILSNQRLFQRVEEIRRELNQDCKIIIRPSGTEDVVRLSVMAKSEELVSRYLEELYQMIINS